MNTFKSAFLFTITLGLVSPSVDYVMDEEHTLSKVSVPVLKPHWSDAILEEARQAGRLPSSSKGSIRD